MIQINHQPDAIIFQFIILTFIYSSTCFGRFPAHHQELNDCSGSLWFYLRIVVIVVLCSWSGRPARPQTHHGCHHDTKVKPEAATAVIELLMMGGKTPETCWAVNKHQENKLKNFCIWLVIYCAVFVVGAARPRTQHGYHHDTKVKAEAATAVIKLLIMSGETPETCWAVNKRQDNKLKNCCIWLVIYLNSISWLVAAQPHVVYIVYSTIALKSDLTIFGGNWAQPAHGPLLNGQCKRILLPVPPQRYRLQPSLLWNTNRTELRLNFVSASAYCWPLCVSNNIKGPLKPPWVLFWMLCV